ncbi:MAG: hypothetical protein E3J28_00705 [Desulfobacteraceae bacterium]|nr:MAG: hypothetical protein E3J28_00705 [Desulfobacteraceae bacterium]
MASDYLQKIDKYNIRPAWPKPGKCALLVIDMQQFFLPIASPIIRNVLSNGKLWLTYHLFRKTGQERQELWERINEIEIVGSA